MAASADVPSAPAARGHVRVVLPARGLPARAGGRVDPLHGPQAARATRARGSVWCTVFDAARGRAVHAQAHERRADASPPAAGSRSATRATQHGRRGGAEGGCGACGAAQLVAALRPRRSPSCATCRASGCTARRCRARSSRAPRRRRASTATLELGGRARSSSTAGAAWSATTGAPSTPSAGSGCTASASRRPPEAWLDVALGRVQVAGRMTPWVANGALSLDGRRLPPRRPRRARPARRRERPRAARCELPGEDGLRVEAHVDVPPGTAAGWRYADPDGGEHDVVNCSIAALELTVDAARRAQPARR